MREGKREEEKIGGGAVVGRGGREVVGMVAVLAMKMAGLILTTGRDSNVGLTRESLGMMTCRSSILRR